MSDFPSMARSEAGRTQVLVGCKMTHAPWTIGVRGSLAEAGRMMSEHVDVVNAMVERWDSVLVCEQDRVVGVFTTTDAMRLLAEQLRTTA